MNAMTAPAVPLSPDLIDALVPEKRAHVHPFRHVLSLGTSCYSSWTIKGLGLKRQSFPFDWIFSSPAMVLDALGDRFQSFMDPTHYEPIAADQRHEVRSHVCHHRRYREQFGVDFMFNHADPTDAKVHAYYRRCVDRFYSVLASGEKALLVMVNPKEHLGLGGFARLCGLIDGLSGNATVLVIDVAAGRDTLNMGMDAVGQIGRHRLRVFRSSSPLDGVAFGNPIDDAIIRAAIMQFRFDLPGAS